MNAAEVNKVLLTQGLVWLGKDLGFETSDGHTTSKNGEKTKRQAEYGGKSKTSIANMKFKRPMSHSTGDFQWVVGSEYSAAQKNSVSKLQI